MRQIPGKLSRVFCRTLVGILLLFFFFSHFSCSVQDPVYLEWEALVNVLDGVLSRILLVTERPSVSTGLRLLEQCLRIDSRDPLIKSIVMSCISSLFVFLSMSSCQITSG